MRLARPSPTLGIILAGSLLVAGCGGGDATAEPGTDGNSTLDPGKLPSPTGNGVATLAWTPPLENTDGSSITDLNGYRIHYGESAGDYPYVIEVKNSGLAAYTVENLASGTQYFFVVTAVNSEGIESAYSEVATKIIN